MQPDQITSPADSQVIPVVYLDLDIVNETDFQEEIASYPGMRCLMLAEYGPGGGNPVFRIEGPLDSLINWLLAEYNANGHEEVLALLKDAKLAR